MAREGEQSPTAQPYGAGEVYRSVRGGGGPETPVTRSQAHKNPRALVEVA